jgi:hypothetical protein
MGFLFTLVIIPLLAIAPGLTVRPVPWRVDAGDRAGRFTQHCRRIAFLLLLIPVLVMCLIIALLVHRFNGGPGLTAYHQYLSIGGRLWKLSSVVGILSGIGACFDSTRRSDGYRFIASHAMLLFLVLVGPQLQYAGHPD